MYKSGPESGLCMLLVLDYRKFCLRLGLIATNFQRSNEVQSSLYSTLLSRLFTAYGGHVMQPMVLKFHFLNYCTFQGYNC